MKAINGLPEVCISFSRRNVHKNEDWLPTTYKDRTLALREAINGLYTKTGLLARGTILLTFDFEVRKNLLYVDWNERIRKWNRTLLKDDDVERDDLSIELIRELERDDDLESAIEREIEKSEEEAEMELEDADLKVEDADYNNVIRLSYPKNLLFALKFFKKYITSEVIK